VIVVNRMAIRLLFVLDRHNFTMTKKIRATICASTTKRSSESGWLAHFLHRGLDFLVAGFADREG
jgi:hypothetical protein